MEFSQPHFQSSCLLNQICNRIVQVVHGQKNNNQAKQEIGCLIQQIDHLNMSLISIESYLKVENVYTRYLKNTLLGHQLIKKIVQNLSDYDIPVKIRFIFLYSQQFKMQDRSQKLQNLLFDAFQLNISLSKKLHSGFKCGIVFLEHIRDLEVFTKFLNKNIVYLKAQVEDTIFISNNPKVVSSGKKKTNLRKHLKMHKENQQVFKSSKQKNKAQKLPYYELLLKCYTIGSQVIRDAAKKFYYNQCRKNLQQKLLREYRGKMIHESFQRIRQQISQSQFILKEYSIENLQQKSFSKTFSRYDSLFKQQQIPGKAFKSIYNSPEKKKQFNQSRIKVMSNQHRQTALQSHNCVINQNCPVNCIKNINLDSSGTKLQFKIKDKKPILKACENNQTKSVKKGNQATKEQKCIHTNFQKAVRIRVSQKNRLSMNKFQQNKFQQNQVFEKKQSQHELTDYQNSFKANKSSNNDQQKQVQQQQRQPILAAFQRQQESNYDQNLVDNMIQQIRQEVEHRLIQQDIESKKRFRQVFSNTFSSQLASENILNAEKESFGIQVPIFNNIQKQFCSSKFQIIRHIDLLIAFNLIYDVRNKKNQQIVQRNRESKILICYQDQQFLSGECKKQKQGEERHTQNDLGQPKQQEMISDIQSKQHVRPSKQIEDNNGLETGLRSNTCNYLEQLQIKKVEMADIQSFYHSQTQNFVQDNQQLDYQQPHQDQRKQLEEQQAKFKFIDQSNQINQINQVEEQQRKINQVQRQSNQSKILQVNQSNNNQNTNSEQKDSNITCQSQIIKISNQMIDSLFEFVIQTLFDGQIVQQAQKLQQHINATGISVSKCQLNPIKREQQFQQTHNAEKIFLSPHINASIVEIKEVNQEQYVEQLRPKINKFKSQASIISRKSLLNSVGKIKSKKSVQINEQDTFIAKFSHFFEPQLQVSTQTIKFIIFDPYSGKSCSRVFSFPEASRSLLYQDIQQKALKALNNSISRCNSDDLKEVLQNVDQNDLRPNKIQILRAIANVKSDKVQNIRFIHYLKEAVVVSLSEQNSLASVRIPIREDQLLEKVKSELANNQINVCFQESATGFLVILKLWCFVQKAEITIKTYDKHQKKLGFILQEKAKFQQKQQGQMRSYEAAQMVYDMQIRVQGKKQVLFFENLNRNLRNKMKDNMSTVIGYYLEVRNGQYWFRTNTSGIAKMLQLL